MSWLIFIMSVELGWLPSGTLATYDVPPGTEAVLFDVTGNWYAAFDAEAQAGPVFVGGALKTDVWSRAEDWTFWPHTAWYSVRAGFRSGPLEIGARHYCIHPVVPWLAVARPQWEAAYDEVYVRLTARSR